MGCSECNIIHLQYFVMCCRSVETKDDIKTFIEYSHYDSSHDLQVGETEITPKMSNVRAAKSHKLLELFISFHCFVDMHY